LRLGFSIRVYGCPDLPSYDGRPAYESPHLSISLAYLRDILFYLRANDIPMYRMHSRLIPLSSDAGLGSVYEQIKECELQLAALGQLVREDDVRLSFHPDSTVVLNAINEDQVACSVAHLEAQAALMAAMGLGPEAVIVLHVGGVYDDAVTSRERFVRRYEALPSRVRPRLVLENDDHRFSYADIRLIHEACGVPLVLDNLHHLVLNREGVPMREALDYCLNTWPEGVRPKIHFSTPRTEMRLLERSSRIKVPTWTEHGDFVSPFEFISFMRMADGLGSVWSGIPQCRYLRPTLCRHLRPFDVMLEAKARDLALLKLRQDLRRFAPQLAERMRKHATG